MKQRNNALFADCTPDWELYRRGRDFLRVSGYSDEVRDAWKFFGDRQWEGYAADEVFGSDGPPFVNFIKPSVIYKLVTVASNGVKIVFNPSPELPEDFRQTAEAVCNALTAYCGGLWENMKMDSLRWRAIRDAVVTGDGYLYFYRENGRQKAALIDSTALLPADENEPELQAQDYILLVFRKSVKALREQAEKDRLSADAVERIVADDETDCAASGEGKNELPHGAEGGKATVVLKLWREKGRVYMRSSTRQVQLTEKTDTGLSLYPIAAMRWEEVKGSARGRGIVTPQIPNQVEFNKTLARRAIKVMETAYPKVVYNSTRVDNPEELDNVGAKISVTGDGLPVRSVVDYLSPTSSSPDVGALASDLMTLSQRTYGASEAAMGNINPENASGKAILAVQDAAAQVLSLQSQQHAQFIEDIALILFDYWRAYSPAEGRVVSYTDEQTGAPVRLAVPSSVLEALAVRVKVEVSPTGAYSQLAVEQTLENYMQAGKISFAEMVEALPDNSLTPKSTLLRILRRRATQ